MTTATRTSLPVLLAVVAVIAMTRSAPAACTIVLGDEAGRQLGTAACGAELPDNSWTIGWVEDENRISLFALSRDHLLSAIAANAALLVPRATVVVPEAADVESVIVFAPDVERPAGALAFRRWMKPGEPVNVPAGRVFAIAFDKRNRPNGVAAMATIPAGKIGELRIDRDADRLVVELERAARRVAEKDDLGQVELELEDDGRAAPSLRSTGLERTFLVWDAPQGRSANLRIASPKYFLRQTAVRLGKGVVGVRGLLEPLPTLKVEVRVEPFDALPEDEVLTLSLTDGSSLLRTLELRPNTEVDLESMPLSIIDAKLSMGDIHFARREDLSEGVDATVSFELEPLTVEGTLRYGGEPAEGEVAFTGDGYSARVETDDGRYRATVWEKRRYGVVVTLHGRPEVPTHTDTIRIDESRTFDIDVPSSSIRVSVIDDESEAPIPKAFVYAKNSWITPEGERRGVARTSRTDDDGVSILPPLRPGTVELIVTAEGYENGEPVTRDVTASDRGTPVRIRLKPHGAMDTVRVVLPNGAPAAGALFKVVSEDMQQSFLYGSADEQGEVKLSADARGVLLIRHPHAGGVARLWASGTAGGPATVQMPPRTGRQVFRVLRPNGEKALSARVLLLLNGIVIADGGLSFLTGLPSSSNVDGKWVADGLPAGLLKAAAVTLRGRSQISVRELESFAGTLQPDRPIVTID